MSLKEKAHIMDEAAMERALVRIAHQIVEKNHGTDHLCLVGIKTRGVPLARRLGKNISQPEGVDVPGAEVARVLDQLESGEHAGLHVADPRNSGPDRLGRRHGNPSLRGTRDDHPVHRGVPERTRS